MQELIQGGLKDLQMLKVSAPPCITPLLQDRDGRGARLPRIEYALASHRTSWDSSAISFMTERVLILLFNFQRQTVVSQFFQLDRLVVEGQKTVSLLFPNLACNFAAKPLTQPRATGETDGP